METIHTVGRRKTSIARVYMSTGQGEITVNNKSYKDYFPTLYFQNLIEDAFRVTNNEGAYDVKINVKGGGLTGQAEAARLGIARALVIVDEEFKDALKSAGMLKRDPRMVERKKPGKPKARKNFQFRKR
jgi:small subunit ribosomal protein S9